MKKWIQFTTDLIKNSKLKNTHHRYQLLLYFIPIEILQVDKQPSSEQNIINLSMSITINIPFNETPMTWDLIHGLLLHTSYSVMT